MKDKLVRGVGRVLPGAATRAVRHGYRKTRVHVASSRYGYAARYLKTIAVTGTSGKTTTVHYLGEILKSAGFTTALATTLGVEINGKLTSDKPLTRALGWHKFFRDAKKADVDYVVIEVSAYDLDAHLLDTVPIECVVLTGTAPDNLHYFADAAAYTATLSSLLARTPRYIVLNADDENFAELQRSEAGEHKISYGANESADCRIRQVKLYKKGSEVQLLIDHHTTLELGTALPGRHNVYNMTAAAMAAYLMYIKLEAIQDGIANLEPLPHRFERLALDKPYDVIVDSAHTATSLESVLESARGMTKNRLIVVLSTDAEDTTQLAPLGEVAARLADRIFVTHAAASNDNTPARAAFMSGIASAGGEPKAEEIADARDAVSKAMSVARTGDTVIAFGVESSSRFIDETSQSLRSKDERELSEPAKKESAVVVDSPDDIRDT